jgi:hypothetical protein
LRRSEAEQLTESAAGGLWLFRRKRVNLGVAPITLGAALSCCPSKPIALE